jgi:hypothetical protein
MEDALMKVVNEFGYDVVRLHPFKKDEGHGFIGSQKEGMKVFAGADPDAPIIVAECVWQYSHHLSAWPDLAPRADPHGRQLVGHVAGPRRHAELERLSHQGGREVRHDLVEDFTDDFFRDYLQAWLKDGHVKHRTPHVTKWKHVKIGSKEKKLADSLAAQLKREKAIMGSLRRGVHGDVQRDHPRRAVAPHRRV